MQDSLARQDIAPPLSIVVATIQGWPTVRASIASVEKAAVRVGGEVIVGDGSGLPAPAADELAPGTTWFTEAEASIFQLRQAGYARSRGAIVALTEDHCRVDPDWGERILASHAEHPSATAIGGSVVNGATETLLDWASFFVVQTLFMAPIASGPTRKINGAVNVSYKREALEGLSSFGGLGAMDVLHQRQLAESGALLVADDRIRCVHDQALGLGTPIVHFHAGRTISGFRRREMSARQWTRFAATFLVPMARLALILAIGLRKPQRQILIRSLPYVWLLLMCQAAGQFIGYVAGPGDSPRRVY
jgi:hypothetical protein